MKRLETERTNELGELFFCAIYHINSYWEPDVVNLKAASKVKSATGCNIKGFSIRLYTDNLKHFLGEHVSEWRKNQVPVRMSDLEKIPSYVNYFGAVSVDLKNPNRLHFKKETSTGIVHFIAEMKPRLHELVGVTLWIQRR